jgi:hypothetical protein
MPSTFGIVSSASTYVHPSFEVYPDTTGFFGGPATVTTYQENGWQYALVTGISGNTANISPTIKGEVQIILISGGGGGGASTGGNTSGGGGGAGGYLGPSKILIDRVLQINLGAAGIGAANANTAAVSGGETNLYDYSTLGTYSGLRAYGGGQGGTNGTFLAGSGASGGGGGTASTTSFSGGYATPSGQGNAGGNAFGSNTLLDRAGGGGGGATATGSAGVSKTGGAGGSGFTVPSGWDSPPSPPSGWPTSGKAFSAGGGGGANITGGAGGSSGSGGAGGIAGTAATAASTIGSGGGAAGVGANTNNLRAGKDGYSGMVWIRWRL